MERERSVPEIISLLAQWVDRAEKQPDYDDPELQTELKELLRMIENVDREELEKVKKEMDSPELKKRCEAIHSDVERAREALKNDNPQRVYHFLEDILKLEEEVYKRIETYDLTQNIQKGDFIGEGRNAEVFEVLDHDYENLPAPENLVIKIIKENRVSDHSSALETFKRYMKLEQQVPQKVQIARFRKIGFYEKKAAVIMDKAPGREAHWEPDSVKGEVSAEEWYQNWSKMNELMAKAPDNHYDKLARDLKYLRIYNIGIDPKSDNFFYHKQEGFTIVDLAKTDLVRSREKEGRYQPDILGSLARPGLAGKFMDQVTEADVRNIQAIEKQIDRIGNPHRSDEVIERTKRRIRKLETKILE